MENIAQQGFSVESQPVVSTKIESYATLHPPPIQHNEPNQSLSVVISIPPSLSGLPFAQVEKASLCNSEGKLHSPTTPTENTGNSYENQQKNSSLMDKHYNSFKTLSGRLERQISNLRGKPQEPDVEAYGSQITEIGRVPQVARYFDALEGPELDILKASEVSILPEDKTWPFLLRFPISTFGICLGMSAQSVLWLALSQNQSLTVMHVPVAINFVIWCMSLTIMVIVSIIYSFKIIYCFEAVRREYYHPVRVNFFFAPWIACLTLVNGMPPSVTVNLHPILWYMLMAPILCLELKIYGQWMSGGERMLSKVANPSNHLSIVGNFVGALVGARMGLKEGPIFFFVVGLAHYIVLFVTLYQRLPTNVTLPKDLHPVFFLFISVPSVASIAWEKISDEFDYVARIAYFIALFLYISLAVRINFFRGFRFSLSWWAYSFPMTAAATATIRYWKVVTNPFTRMLAIGLSTIAAFTVMALFVVTIVMAFVLHDLFPNDIAIAITEKKPKSRKMHKHLKTAWSGGKGMENSVPSNAP